MRPLRSSVSRIGFPGATPGLLIVPKDGGFSFTKVARLAGAAVLGPAVFAESGNLREDDMGDAGFALGGIWCVASAVEDDGAERVVADGAQGGEERPQIRPGEDTKAVDQPALSRLQILTRSRHASEQSHDGPHIVITRAGRERTPPDDENPDPRRGRYTPLRFRLLESLAEPEAPGSSIRHLPAGRRRALLVRSS